MSAPKIPEYLDDPIDIMSDSVLEMAEKLAFKAHEGKYVEGLFDASLSTTVGLIHEKVDWQPMKLNFHGGDLAYSYDPEVSDVPFYCRHSGLNKFHGYVSEPPIAPAFRESAPVGLAAPALRAFGKMEALLEADGREEEIEDFKDYFCSLWGIDASVLTNTEFLKPDITSRSDIDLLKSLRSKSHRLYGYENEQNYVSVEMGNYSQGTLSERRYIDWHRVNIILRFIGVFLITTDPVGVSSLRDENKTLYYGLVSSEFPLVTKSPHAPSFKNFPKGVSIPFLNSALTTTMQYYSSGHVQKAISHSLMATQSKVRLAPSFQMDEIAVATLRNALNTKQKSVNFTFKANTALPYDILPPDVHQREATKRSRLTKVDIHHQLSMRRAAELVLMTRLQAHWNSSNTLVLRQTLDRFKRDIAFSLEMKMETARAVITLYGGNSGTDVWLVAKKFRRDAATAQEDFIKFCLEMLEPGAEVTAKTLPTLWWDCIRTSSAYQTLKTLYLNAWNKYAHMMNHPSIPKFPTDAKLIENKELVCLVSHLWNKKRDYWIGHYKQRRDDNIQKLRREQDKEEGPSQDNKASVIRYQWLVRWLSKYTPVVQNDLEVWPEIRNQTALDLLSHTALKFLRKRKADAIAPVGNEPYKTYARRLDRELQPTIQFNLMVDMVHNTAKMMTGDIAYMFRKIMEPDESPEDGPDSMWKEELTKAYMEEERWKDVCSKLDRKVDWSELDEEEQIPDFKPLSFFRPMAESRAEAAMMEPVIPSTFAGDLTNDSLGIDEDEEDFQEPLVELDLGIEEDFDNIDFDLPVTLPKVSMFSGFSMSAELSAEVLRNKSALVEMNEKHGRIPDVTKWANAANVELSDLAKASGETFARIMKVGTELLQAALDEEVVVSTSYDVV